MRYPQHILLTVNVCSPMIMIYKKRIIIIKTMSKQHFEKALRDELEVLNETIDRKIIKGLSYAAEARRHKTILSQILEIRRRETRSGWFSRSFGFTSFIF